MDAKTDHKPHELGKRGEQLAAEYLESQGIVVLSRNWRHHEGELDIVATDGVRLVVCEVKTRASSERGAPADAVTPAKAARIRRLAGLWLATYRVRPCPLRFDIVAIIWSPDRRPQVEHLRGAF